MYKSLYIGVLGVMLGVLGCTEKPTAEVIPGQYIVVMKKPVVQLQSVGKSIVANLAQRVEARHHIGAAKRLYAGVLQGGVYNLSDEEAAQLRADPAVAYVEADQFVYASDDVSSDDAPWGLDRLDQEKLPLTKTYDYDGDGKGVNVYVIDTGILLSHKDFEGRAKSGHDFVDDDEDATDCNGHGTHVAGTVAGKKYGVAKAATLYAVRVLNCGGRGSFSDVIAGIEWVTEHHDGPSVANMSLGGGASRAIDEAIAASIQAGVTYVVAAGNESTDACYGSPARVPEAVTVGSVDRADARSWFSNYGSCVDLFAPGSDITSDWYTSPTATNTISGTSMASPHVAGVAVLYKAKNPSATPAQVQAALVKGAVADQLSDLKSGSPNLLLNTEFLKTVEQDPGAPADRPTPCTDCEVYAGSLAGPGDYAYQPNGTYYQTNARGTHQFWLQGSAGADFDLYLYRWTGMQWQVVASATSSYADEVLSFTGAAGYYVVTLVDVSGKGPYKLYKKMD